MTLLSYFFPCTLGVFHSKINGEIKVKEIFGQRQIYVDNFPQSGDVMTRMWEEIMSNVKCQMSNVKRCLILGVGGGTVIKIIKKHFPKAKIVGIEIDPVMIEIGKKYFKLNHFNDVKLTVDDAFSWVNKNSQSGKFDLIIVDLFIGRENLAQSRGKSFMLELNTLLSKIGIVVFNTHLTGRHGNKLNNLVKMCQSIFDKVDIARSFSKNSILFMNQTEKMIK